jgi:peptidoglycan hydrolase CwlO-like protein
MSTHSDEQLSDILAALERTQKELTIATARLATVRNEVLEEAARAVQSHPENCNGVRSLAGATTLGDSWSYCSGCNTAQRIRDLKRESLP